MAPVKILQDFQKRIADKRARGTGLWQRLCRDQSGVVSVELAITAIFLAIVSLGTYDFSRYGMESLRVSQAARAGLQYALQDPTNASNASAIEQAVRNDASDTANQLSISVGAPFCGCPGQVSASCGSTCSDGGYALQYVQLTVQSSIDMAFSYPGIPSSIPISTTSQIRLN